MIGKVREIVKKECSSNSTMNNWTYHIEIVVKYAKLLAEKMNSDAEMAELAALLHDIGRIKFGSKDHEKTGLPEAEKILKEVGYSQDIIDEIKHCVESHRGSKDIVPKTITAKITTNADAMSHFDIIPLLFKVALKRSDNNLEDTLQWINDKIERDWNKKMTIPEAKEIMKEKYHAFRVLFDSMIELSKKK